MKSAVLFLTFNRLDYTRKCLDHYIGNTKHLHKIVIADSGSVDGTREFIKDVEKNKKYGDLDIDFIYYKKNYGPHRPRSHFLHTYHKQYQYLGFVSNDILVSPGWLPAFEEMLDKVPKIGIIGPVDRDWPGKLIAHENGKEFFKDTEFYWSDGYWLMRGSLIPEIKKLKIKITKDEVIDHPGYFYFNLFGNTQGWYWNSIRQTGHYTACDPKHRMHCVWEGTKNGTDWHKKYNLLSRRIYCENPEKYIEDTSGPMIYEQNGKTIEFKEEPKYVYTTPSVLLESAKRSLTAQLEHGVKDSDRNMLTEEQWKKLTYEDIFHVDKP